MTAPSSGLGALAPPMPLPCERCGEAPASARLRVGLQTVCAPCASALEAERKDALRPPIALWPTVLIFLTGFLSPVAPPVLAAISWWRMGEPRRVRDCLLLGAAGVLCAAGEAAGVLLRLPSQQGLPLVFARVIIAFFAVVPLRRRYVLHRERGGRRASLWAPVLISLALNLAIGATVMAGLVATGKLDLEKFVRESQQPLSVEQGASPARSG
jgi:hypothetical protein